MPIMSNEPISPLVCNLFAVAAKAGKGRKKFITEMEKSFTFIGEGAFRLVFASNDFVIKVRRHKPDEDCGFSQRQINSSNQDETNGYEELSSDWEHLPGFVVKPILVELPHGHDVVIMERVTPIRSLVDDGEEADDSIIELLETNRRQLLQFQFLQETFMDSHSGNLGINKAGNVVIFDFNIPLLFFDARKHHKKTDSTAKRLLKPLNKEKITKADLKPINKEKITKADLKLLKALAA